MNTEAIAYARELTWVLQQVRHSLSQLSDEQAAWAPNAGDANSALAIANHVIEATRVYALGFGCGIPVERDRSSEFDPYGHSLDSLQARLEQLVEHIHTVLASSTTADLNVRFTPAPELWGTGEIHELSRRDAVLESIRHAALHLGELRLTCTLARERS